MKVFLGASPGGLAAADVEAREPERAGHGIDQRRDPAQAALAPRGPEMDHQRRRHAEVHEVAERVELGPHGALAAEPPRQPSVEPVEHRRQEDQAGGDVERPCEREADRRQPGAEREPG